MYSAKSDHWCPSRPSHSFRRNAYDVVVIGGATNGSAIAWFLSANPDFSGGVLVLEKDASLERSATMTSNNCMRQQFARGEDVAALEGRKSCSSTHTTYASRSTAPLGPLGVRVHRLAARCSTTGHGTATE